MNENPLISILSSVFNERLYIGQAIRSVLRQTYKDWEWIIIDDGSTDGTRDILKGINDSRVKCFFEEHTGNVASNMNKALSISRGDIIATLDGDDYWPENKLDIQVNSFDDPDVVLSYGSSFLIDFKGNNIGNIEPPKDSRIAHNLPIGSALKRLLVDVDCFICNTTVMYRKRSLLDVGGFVERKGIFQDFPTWINLALTGRFLAIQDFLGYYRKHLSSTSLNVNHISYFRNHLDFLREFINSHSGRLRDIGLAFDLKYLEKHWNRIERKNRIIYRLTSLSLFAGVDFVNPLIYYVNGRPHIKSFLQKLLGI